MRYPRYKREEKLNTKLSDDDITQCKKLRKLGKTLNLLAIEYGVNQSTMRVALLDDEEKKELNRKRYAKYGRKLYGKIDLEVANRCRARKKELYPEETKLFFKLSMSKWYKKNKQKALEEQMKYYFKNKSKINKKRKEHYFKNKQKVLDRQMKYYFKNKEARGKYAKEYYKKYKEKILAQSKLYHAKNKELIAKKEKEKYLKNREQILKKRRERYYKKKHQPKV